MTLSSNPGSAPVMVTADSPDGLASVSCSDIGACRAADDSGAVVALAAGKWTRSTTAGGPFAAISCPTTSSCMAIDEFGLALRYDPYGWGTLTAVDLPNTLTSLSCASDSFCAAVDALGQSVTYNGTPWGAPTVADSTGGLNGVSSTSCTAVGPVDAVSYVGTGWTASRTIAFGIPLTLISCRITASCVATGDDGSAVVQRGGT